MGLESWVERPLSVAAELSRGECNGHYMDACLIVSGLISGIASFLWPGTKGDRRRFIEAWIRFSARDGHASLVSVPLLRLALLKENKLSEAAALYRQRGQFFGPGFGSRVVHGDEVDADEATLQGEIASIDVSTLRRHAYPTIFCEDVRCKLVHEGELNGTAAPFPMTIRKDARVSYVNRTLSLPDADGDAAESTAPDRDRRIFFHMAFLADLTRAMARNVDMALANGPIPWPTKWWIDG